MKSESVSITLHIDIETPRKAVLPQNVATAIEIFRDSNISDFNGFIMQCAMLGGISPTAHIIREYACSTTGGFFQIILALHYGYDMEI